MKPFRSLISGILVALLCTLMVFGALSIALSEGGVSLPADEPTQVVPEMASPTIPPTAVPNTSAPGTSTVSMIQTLTATPTLRMATITPTTSVCPPPPAGWEAYTILPGDTLADLALTHQVPTAQIITVNCLLSETLMPGTYIYLPRAIPTATLAFTVTLTSTRTPIPCGPPSNWVTYIVQPGDTLFKLSLDFGVSVSALQFANCMGSSTLIIAGQHLKVPNVPTRTPTPTATDRPPSRTDTPIPSHTPTLSPTHTPVNTFTPTTVPSDTPTTIPTATASNTPIPPASPTPQPTISNTPEPTTGSTQSGSNPQP